MHTPGIAFIRDLIQEPEDVAFWDVIYEPDGHIVFESIKKEDAKTQAKLMGDGYVARPIK